MAESGRLDYWRRQAEASELRLVWKQVESHHSLSLLRWTAYDDLPEVLATWAYEVEVLALAMRDTCHASTDKHAEDAKKIAALDARVSSLITELRQARSLERRAA